MDNLLPSVAFSLRIILNLLDIEQFQWHRHQESVPGQPIIDYWSSVLSVSDSGRIEILYRWEPNAHCHFHRHRAETTSIVLQGELNVADYVDGKVIDSWVRPKGHRSFADGQEVHREWGGPQGALVYFNLYAEDGLLADQLDNNGNIIRTTSLSDVTKHYNKTL